MITGSKDDENDNFKLLWYKNIIVMVTPLLLVGYSGGRPVTVPVAVHLSHLYQIFHDNSKEPPFCPLLPVVVLLPCSDEKARLAIFVSQREVSKTGLQYWCLALDQLYLDP